MSDALYDFLAQMTRRAAANLETAYLRLPADRRRWSPGGAARTAADMVAECAFMNDISGLVEARAFPPGFDAAALRRIKAALMEDDDRLLGTLRENAERGIAALRTAPVSDLGAEVKLITLTVTLGQIIAYPYWNMSYHEGQINYIAAQLEGTGG